MKAKGQFVSLPVKSKHLAKYISYFYFYENTVVGEEESYVFYPNHRLALTIYKESKSFLDNGDTVVSEYRKGRTNYLFSGLRNQSLLVKMQTPFNKIGIVFHPMGINHFIDKPFKQFHPDKNLLEIDFRTDEMEETVALVFKESDLDKKVELLEAYFEKQLVEFKEQRILDAVDFIIQAQLNITAEAVSEAINVNRKTLLRLFRKHLDCTIKEYIDIVKFRKAIEMYQRTNDKPKLTDLALETGYYDQSNFIQHFKKITGTNPKSLFKKIDHFGTEDTFWTSLTNE